MSTEKAILEFDLTDPDARQAHLRSVNALSLCAVINSMNERLRSLLKYEDDRLSNANAYDEIERLRDEFLDIQHQNGIFIDDLY